MVRLSALLFAVAVLLEPPNAGAVERHVTPETLDGALSEAEAGDILILAEGVYRGPLTISRAVKVLGGRDVVIDGGGAGTTVTLAADGSALDGIVVRNSGRDLSHDDAAILLHEVHHATVERCTVEGRGFGIYIRAGGDNRVAYNYVHGDTLLRRSQRGNGIHLWHTERNEVTGNRLVDVRDGLYLCFAHHNVISDNSAAAVRYGIHYMYSDDNLLERNRVERCVGGAAVMFTRGSTVRANECVGNRMFGILCLDVDSSTIAGNLVAGNGRGLFVEDSSYDRFIGNRIENNGVGAFVTGGAESNVFAKNDFEANLVQAFVEYGGINAWSENGRGNFWSDYIGFDFNGDGIGDLPYRLQSSASALMARRPQARFFMMSPALALLDWWESQAVGAQDGFLDRSPLVNRTAAREGR